MLPRGRPFSLWNFTGYKDVATEAVASADDPDARRRWHWES